MAEFPPLMDEIVVSGARAITASLRRPKPAAPIDIERAKERRAADDVHLQAAAQTIADRVEVGGAVVEYLDKMLIDGKRLGDCARADLEKERERLARRGTALLSQADLLARIARCLAPNEIVRASGSRPAILEILREHFQA